MGQVRRLAGGLRALCLALLAGAAPGFAQYTISTVAGGAPPATPVTATSISIGNPRRVAVDGGGNVYFTSLNCVFKVTTGGTLTLIAGNSRAGYSGDGGPATQAQLNAPTGLAIDASGDIFIADTGNNAVREVTPNGNITTVAGNGTPGNSGDAGPATQAQLHGPSGVAVDSSGDVYIADSGNNTIRIATSDGNINTFAGDGYANFYPAANQVETPTRGELHNPQDVGTGPNGGIYIVDTGNSYIRLVVNGAISAIAGSGAVGFAGDGGAANAVTTTGGGGVGLYDPEAIAFDSAGNYYLADAGNSRIRKIDTKSIIHTFAGSGAIGFGGDGSPAVAAVFNFPTGIAIDSQGNMYIADSGNARIRKISSSGTVSTIAGNGTVSYSGDGGPATAAQLNGPQGVATDRKGNLFIADSQNAVVRIANAAGISSVGGGSFQLPRGIATDQGGNAYVADSLANRVWRVGTDGSVTAFAGSGTRGYAGDGGAGPSSQLNAPTAVAVDSSGNVYIDDFGNNRIREVAANGTINTVAGNGSQGYSGDGGPATGASINQALGIAVDSAGNLYITDSGNNVIREVTNGNIATIAGTGLAGYSGDGGPASSAQMAGPSGISVDSSGNIYFIDGTTWVRRIDTSGNITTITGNGLLGYSGDAGVATQASLNDPMGLWADLSGNIYIADTGNNAIRLLQPPAPAASLRAVTNAASNQAGAIAPGEIVVLYGSAIGPSHFQSYRLDANGMVPTSVAGTSVTFNGIAAPVLYTSPVQVAAVAPFGLTGQSAQV
ncbi:MAG: hypothetical protein JO336_07165, partial [Acidobacteriia bacterium]|nr:hypothetical protein [Terriglobia bacterium]